MIAVGVTSCSQSTAFYRDLTGKIGHHTRALHATHIERESGPASVPPSAQRTPVSN